MYVDSHVNLPQATTLGTVVILTLVSVYFFTRGSSEATESPTQEAPKETSKGSDHPIEENNDRSEPQSEESGSEEKSAPASGDD